MIASGEQGFRESSFNSRMVRLKAAESPANVSPLNWFQFQNGSIKRGGRKLMERSESIGFQFQNGSIKRLVPFFGSLWRLCFNSRMVRLKDAKGRIMAERSKAVSIPEWFD